MVSFWKIAILCLGNITRNPTIKWHLNIYALISGNPGGLTRGNSAGFADFCQQFLARGGGIGPLLHSRGKIHGERPAGSAWTGYIASKHMQADETVCSLKLSFFDLQGVS